MWYLNLKLVVLEGKKEKREKKKKLLRESAESTYSIIVNLLTFYFLEKKGLKTKNGHSFPTPQ
jgi:hypothetical protein